MYASIPTITNGTFEFCDKLQHGGNKPVLWLLDKSGQVHTFKGVGIDRVCSVLTEQSCKNGKWSYTDYTVRVGSALPVRLLAPMHKRTWENEGSWEDAEQAFQDLVQSTVDWNSFRAAVARDFPKTAERWAATATCQLD